MQVSRRDITEFLSYKPSARALARLPNESLSSGLVINLRSELVKANVSPGSTQNPASLANRYNSLPVVEVATSGRPLASMPNNFEGSTKSAASAF